MQLLITIIFILIYCYFNEYLDNKKYKNNQYKKTTAKIIKLTKNWHQHKTNWRNPETNHEEIFTYETSSFSFIYEYTVNGDSYTGNGHSIFKKKNGQEVQIYYNELNPEKNELALKDKDYIGIFIILGISLIMYWIRIYL